MKNRTPSFEKNDNLPQGLSFGIRTLQSVQREENGNKEKVYCHNYYDIIWVTRGRGIHRVDLQQFDIRDHRLFCVQPGEVYVLEAGEELEGYVISFSQGFLGIDDVEFDMVYPGGIYQLFDRCKALQVQPELIADMTLITERLVKEYKNPDPFRMELLRRYFKIFLIYLSRQFEEMGRQANPIRAIGLVQKFMELLNINFKAMRMVADYVRQLSVTPNYLNESIKKATGYPASHHIRQRIALEAKRKATYSDVCMKEIAYHLGFSDSAHFSKFFKNTTGMNFTDFKKERFSPVVCQA